MRIAFYNHTSAVSGAEISMLLTAKHFSKAEPIIFAPEGEVLERAQSIGIRVMPTPSYRARLRKNPFLLIKDMIGMLAAGWKLASILKKEPIDLIHANSIRAGIMAGLFKWYHKTPIIWHMRDIPPKGLVGRAVKLLGRITAEGFIGISKSVLENFSDSSLKARSYLVHNGVELTYIGDQEKQDYRKKIREELRTPQNAKVATIIGQIAPWKRQEDAIRATAKLIQDGTEVFLWIVGIAKFRKENELYFETLKSLVYELGIEDRVIFAGFREDVLEICCASDILLLCSDNEPFGRVVIEAMSQGTPVIGTEAGGVPEIIRNGINGMMYPVSEYIKLSHLMSQLFNDPQLMKRLSDNGLLNAEQNFSIKQTAEKVENIYQNVLQGDASRSIDPAHSREVAK
ncbi:glycosyltransferase involved in cell wall biosynthesis [Paenibacillus phyllosphaerae]|uniref:Glycosyltransferase involved in cell wall biosynthesis n=1 Tax=Paenibacillus phyllosphaerae TaxID=274593 RepID=A0A7W5FKV2_9BACL|nr:glycosyltransferase family 4 protein [Paenibacillus phyllosphaerae]MBB3108565.1 glycosyltransferase involved in cell wall biosynthesis [Paenibacillus phyllosphaerae]